MDGSIEIRLTGKRDFVTFLLYFVLVKFLCFSCEYYVHIQFVLCVSPFIIFVLGI